MYLVVYEEGRDHLIVHARGETFSEVVEHLKECLSYSSSARVVKDVPYTIKEEE